jgi:hypothetical protein
LRFCRRAVTRLLLRLTGLLELVSRQGRWQALFGVSFEILLYDLTSTYFESDPPKEGKRRFGYSRDQPPDCVQG